MSNLFHPENKYIQIANKVVDMCFVGLLWLVLSITVVFIGPATSAAYHTMVKVVRKERESVFREFWTALKDNFGNSLTVGLILSFLMFAVYLTDFVYNAPFLATGKNPDIPALIIMAIKVFILLGVGIYAFPMISRFQMKMTQVLISSLLLMVRHFLSTVLMVLVIMLGITLTAMYPYLFLICPGLCFFIITYPMEWVFQKHMRSEDKETDESKDQWYLE